MLSIRKLAVCGSKLRFADKGCGLKYFVLRNRKTLKTKLIILLGSFIEVSLTERVLREPKKHVLGVDVANGMVLTL